jgi:sigma-B regulation protein RsbU (phosphoserine phosphatase)
MSIRWKLLLLIALPVLVVYLAIGVREFRLLKSESINDKRELMEAQAQNFASRFDGEISAASQIADSTASFLTLNPNVSESELYSLIDAAIDHRVVVFGAAIAFEPGAFDPQRELFSPYGFRSGENIAHLDIGADAYDYRDWEWYSAVRDADAPLWTEPYFDEGAGNVLMCTYSAPFYGADGAFRGVATIDIQLVPLQLEANVHALTGGNFVIISGDGRFISHPDPAMIMTTLAERAAEANQPVLLEIQERIGRRESGFMRLSTFPTNEPNWIYFTPVQDSGWSFAVVTPEDVVLDPVYQGLRRLSLSLLGGLVVMLLAIAVVSFRITGPIRRMAIAVRALGAGDLRTRVTGVRSRDEFGELASGFNTMVEQLDEHVDALARESAAREQAEGQLRIASEVQKGLLPRERLDVEGYDIAGWNQPADETGGDYFDWQALHDGQWAISIADVTGHGIGPALVTAFCRAYSRATLRTRADLREVLEEVNNLIYPDLGPGKFVTFAAALLKPASSRVSLLSAGHGPSLLYRAGTGEVEFFIADGVPLGIMEDAEYGPSHELEMAPGDTLLLLTDGFFEWRNATGEQFGTQRLAEELSHCAAQTTEEIVKSIYENVLAFAGGTAQEDDLTIVVIKRTGGSGASEPR